MQKKYLLKTKCRMICGNPNSDIMFHGTSLYQYITESGVCYGSGKGCDPSRWESYHCGGVCTLEAGSSSCGRGLVSDCHHVWKEVEQCPGVVYENNVCLLHTPSLLSSSKRSSCRGRVVCARKSYGSLLVGLLKNCPL